jgi:hypothetical protein
MRRAIAMLLATGGCLLGGACGAQPPQAPRSEAGRLSTALTAIAGTCAEADERQATAPPGRAYVADLDATALNDAAEVAAIAHAHPARIFQEETLGAIAAQTARYLRGCGLDRAARTLDQEAHVRP